MIATAIEELILTPLHRAGEPLPLTTHFTGSAATSRSETYDSRGRPRTVTLRVGGTSGVYALSYEAGTGRVATLSYPSGLRLQYHYDATLGHLLSITNVSDGTSLWTANARDAEMHLTQATSGNGVVTVSYYDPRTGLVQQIRASGDGSDDSSLVACRLSTRIMISRH